MTKNYLLLLTALSVSFFLNVSLGSVHIPFFDVMSILTGNSGSQPGWTDIIWQFRLPKAVTCLLVGASLAVGGLLMQTLFRNPLAGPDVLGLSAGASLLVALLLLAGQSVLFFSNVMHQTWSIAIAATTGSSMVFGLIIIVANRIKDNAALLIIGLMISAGVISIVSVLQFFSQSSDLQSFVIWTFGSVGGVNWNEIMVISMASFTGIALAFLVMKSLNGWLLGENYALSIGINLGRSRLLIVTATSLLVGVTTAFCGPIAFVGLAVPHLVKLLIKSSDHKVLLPAVMMGGAILLLVCDIIAQLPGQSSVLPINAITSLIGAPVVIWIIMNKKVIRV